MWRFIWMVFYLVVKWIWRWIIVMKSCIICWRICFSIILMVCIIYFWVYVGMILFLWWDKCFLFVGCLVSYGDVFWGVYFWFILYCGCWNVVYGCGGWSLSCGDSYLLVFSRKFNFLEGFEYVLIYEDYEGDFMFVGDVFWE